MRFDVVAVVVAVERRTMWVMMVMVMVPELSKMEEIEDPEGERVMVMVDGRRWMRVVMGLG